MKNANFIAIDFETATTSERMPCQIGIAVVREGVITATLEYLIKPPQNKYSQKCISVHGITPDTTKEAPEFPEIWSEISGLFDAAFVVAHNASFDIDVLRRALDFYELDHPILMGYRCTYQDITQASLSASCHDLDIPLDNAHSAGCDAEACARIFIKYLCGEASRSTIHHMGTHKKSYNEEWQREKITGDLLVPDLSHADPNSPFYNKKIVISGVFDTWPNRRDLAELLKKNGADVDSNVGNHTDFLIAGIDAGWKKVKYAKGNGIRIIEERELISILIDSNIWSTPTM